MMPLWTTTSVPEPSVWGWALSSVGRPWVAQRVCPMPMCPVHRALAQQAFEHLDAAGRAPDLESLGPQHGHAGRVVAAVLEALEPLHDDADRVLVADVADDAAHGVSPWLSRVSSCGRPSPRALLARAGDGQRPGRHVLGDHRARAHVGALPDGDGRHEARVGADERAGADSGLVLGGAVVVAGDRCPRRCSPRRRPWRRRRTRGAAPWRHGRSSTSSAPRSCRSWRRRRRATAAAGGRTARAGPRPPRLASDSTQ